MSESRIIKRYTNRKLYDTRDSRYVTLSQIAAMVRAGEDMTVIDNATKEDLTSLTLAQIIYEQEKRQAEVLPLSALRELVRRSEARLADLREGRVGRLLHRSDGVEGNVETSANIEHSEAVGGHPVESPEAYPSVAHGARTEDPDGIKGLFESGRITFEDWQRRVDERLKTLLETVAPFRQLQEELLRVSQRMEELESRVRKLTHIRKNVTDHQRSDDMEKEKNTE